MWTSISLDGVRIGVCTLSEIIFHIFIAVKTILDLRVNGIGNNGKS